jgi:hypothetical protein
MMLNSSRGQEAFDAEEATRLKDFKMGRIIIFFQKNYDHPIIKKIAYFDSMPIVMIRKSRKIRCSNNNWKKYDYVKNGIND